MKTTLPILALMGLAPLALAQDPRPRESQDAANGLARARALFDKVDLDDDGSISAAEAGRSRIPGALFVAHDDDRDRALTREEFNLFYRDLLVSAGRAVPRDLAAEVSRIEAARRTRKAEEDRERTPRPADEAKETDGGESQGSRGTEGPTEAERVAAAREKAENERIQQAREDANAKRAERIAAARQDAEPAGADVAGDPAEPSAERQPTEAERVAAARAKAEADRVDAARAKAEAERIQKARGPAPAANGGGNPARKATPEERAAGYVKRLVDAGRLTPAHARDYYAFLTAPQPAGDVAPDRIAALREAHSRAKDRISGLVIVGGLSAEEGRQLASALDDRARAMLPAPEPAEPVRRTVREEPPAPGPRPAPERAGGTPPERRGGETPPEPERRGAGERGGGARRDAGGNSGRRRDG